MSSSDNRRPASLFFDHKSIAIRRFDDINAGFITCTYMVDRNVP